MTAVQALLGEAFQALGAGDGARTDRLCRQVLAAAPETAEAFHLPALHRLLQRDYAAGTRLMRRAIALDPGRGDLHMNLGRSFNEQGSWSEGEPLLRRALALTPGHPEALNNLANAWVMLGDPAGAIGAYEAALRAQPERDDIRRNLVNALVAAGRRDEAIGLLRALMTRRPDDADGAVTLASALAQGGSLDQAEAVLRAALRARPDHQAAGFALGVTLSDLGRWAEAEDVFHTLVRLDPAHAEAHQARGAVLKILARLTEAVRSQERALELRADFAQAWLSYGAALADCGRQSEAAAAYGWSLKLNPEQPATHGNLCLLMCQMPGVARAALDDEHRAWGHRFGQALAGGGGVAHANRPDPERRLRVGYVSADLRTHSVAYFLESVLAAHDRTGFEIFCYDASSWRDAVTDRLQASTDAWRPIQGLPAREAAALIRADAIDILIDLAGHTAGSRLDVFAFKPAPVQVTWLGYPESTGLAAIDHKITDAVICPEGEGFATEAPLRLPRGVHCYRAPDDAPDVVAPPVAASGRITFGAFHDAPKLSPGVIAAWGAILTRLPEARLVLKAQQFADGVLRDRFLAMLATAGVTPERVEIRGRVASTRAHLAHYGKIDIALDAFPYNGTTTTCEALWMGVPVVTLKGDRPASRVSASLLAQIGLDDLTADTVEGYVECACALARDPDRLAELRTGMRDRIRGSTLGDPKAFTADLDAGLRQAWRAWCGVQPMPAGPSPEPALSSQHPAPVRAVIPDRPRRPAAPFYMPPRSCQIPVLGEIYTRVFGETATGTFVEVGAFDGESYSNTSFLADLGWRGVYIEPVPAFAAACAHRHRGNPAVRVVTCAIGAEDGEASLSVGGALSTLSAEQMTLYRAMGWDAGLFRGLTLTVPLRRLDGVLREQGVAPGFDALIVDVEGGETAVFNGFDLDVWRPRLLIVELEDRNPAYRGAAAVTDAYAMVRRRIIGHDYEELYCDTINTVFINRGIVSQDMVQGRAGWSSLPGGLRRVR